MRSSHFRWMNAFVWGLGLLGFLPFAACASRSYGSEPLSIGDPFGQIEGTHIPSGMRVCVHKFESERGYRISDPSGADGKQCGTNMRWVERDELSFSSDAFRPWLVEIRPGSMIKLDMRYASIEIFPIGDGGFRIEKPLYGQGRCFVHPDVQAKLQRADEAIRERSPGLRLLLLDCYRPRYVSQIMWELIQDPEWVAADGKSSHNKGGAIDLTLARLEGSKPVPVDMGGEFDEFSSVSHYHADGISDEARQFRRILREAMTTVGFRPYDSEWWHFSATGNAEHIDLPL